MTIRDRIIDYLKNHPEGIDDDNLAFSLGLKSRQQANKRCRELEKEGFVKRIVVDGKIHNFWTENYYPKTVTSMQTKTVIQPPEKSKQPVETHKSSHWFWEGNVQSKVINFLVSQKYHIRSVDDTASHQTGIDIIAEKNGKNYGCLSKGIHVELKRLTHQPNPGIGSYMRFLTSLNTAKETKKLSWLSLFQIFHPTVIWQERSPG